MLYMFTQISNVAIFRQSASEAGWDVLLIRLYCVAFDIITLDIRR